ncbi:MAG: Holliday junction branch migration protein RuvA [Dehalococcoidia bacterium]|nr:Holliday junction branch migration protein RuvA [Dehalococcoidia bacterium]
MSIVAAVQGPVSDRGPDSVVVQVGGLHLRVSCPPAFAARATTGSEVRLYTHLVMREDALALYGFENREELTTFEALLAVSGVGPRVALALLSTLGAERLAGAIGNSDIGALTRVPGIGRKTAERITVELREKFKEGAVAATVPGIAADDDVVAALTALGYNATEAAEAARRADGSGATSEERILAALRSLDQK